MKKKTAMKKPSKTNETTRSILDFLTAHGIFAWRSNVVGIPIHREGVITGFRSAGKTGVPDILAVLPFGDHDELHPAGRFLGVEVKTGKDRLRPEQEGFHRSAISCGGIIMVVKDFEDFLRQWHELSKQRQ